MKVANPHILLFINNCTAHVSSGPQDTRLIFFLAKCTSKLQPTDHGVIQNLKVHYRHTVIQCCSTWIFIGLKTARRLVKFKRQRLT